MPRAKGETDEQHMDRLRAARGLPPMREDPDIMGRTRAAVAFCNTQQNAEHLKMAAFLAIFHPDLDPATTRELVNSRR